MSATLTRSEKVVKILTEDYKEIDEDVPKFLELLSKHGADLCWHKHSTFKQHLYQVWKIETIWGLPKHVARCGLFHRVDRSFLQQIIGTEAEELVYTFCTIDRNEVVYHRLLTLEKIPEEGIIVKHIKTGEPVHLSQQLLGTVSAVYRYNRSPVLYLNLQK